MVTLIWIKTTSYVFSFIFLFFFCKVAPVMKLDLSVISFLYICIVLPAKDKQCYSVTFQDPCMPTMEYCLLRVTLCMHLAPLPFWDLKAFFRAVKYFYPVCKWAINREVKQFACVHVARLWKITGPLLEKSFLDTLILLNSSRTFSYTVDARSSSRA